MAFGDLAVDCLFDPYDFVNQLVLELFEEVEGVRVLGIDDPDEQEAILLQLVEG